MLLLIKIFFICLFFFSINLTAQTINSIEITGSFVFDDSEIKNWSGLSTGQKYYPGILDSAKKNIIENLSARGYFNSDFDGTNYEISEDSQRVKIIINLKENEPTFINQIYFPGADSIDINFVIPKFIFLEEKIFSKYELERSISESLTWLENNGYPFAKIILSSVYFYTDSAEGENFADIYIDIEKGNLSRIDKIEIKGSSSTKDYVIVRELRINPGEKYSQKKVEEFPRRLNRLRFFDPVTTPQFYLNSENEGVLLIDIKERQTNNFDGIIGYIPGNTPDESGYLTGLVNVSLRNLFGTGRAAAIRWQQFDRNSQELELKYLEPWIFGYPFNISGGLFQRKQDTTYIHRRLEGGFEFLATEDISAAVSIASENVIPTERINNVFTVFNSSSFTSGINVKVDNRDDPFAPTEGILFLSSYSFSRKKINGPAQFITPGLQTRINLQRITLAVSGFLELFSGQVIALSLNGRELKGTFFEQSDLFRLGGTNSLRGYREDQFFGSRIFWSNLEYRLLLTRRSFAFLFFDTGYFLRKEEPENNILKQEDFKIGYGLGLNIETGLGILGVSFALAQGDSFSDGKIHFGLVNEF